MPSEDTRASSRHTTRKHPEAGSGSRGASAAASAQARRMSDRLDESGAPVVDGLGRAGSPLSPPVTGASVGQAMGNAPIDAETAIQEEIRIKAYERWLNRGGQGGSPQDDWCEAEREVRGKLWSRGSGTEPGT